MLCSELQILDSNTPDSYFGVRRLYLHREHLSLSICSDSEENVFCCGTFGRVVEMLTIYTGQQSFEPRYPGPTDSATDMVTIEALIFIY